MNSKQYEEDWERRKRYLTRSMFAEPSYLSPILEHAEPRSSPEPISPERESPLPDLIIEKEKRYRQNEDETEEFYDQLEIKMKKVYRKLFYGENIDIDDFSIYESENDDYNVPEELRSDSRNVKEAVKGRGETNSFPDNNGEELDSERERNVSVYRVVEEERSASSSKESEVDREKTKSSSENQTEEEKDESDVSGQNTPGNFTRIAENYKVDREKTKSSSENQTEEEKDESDVSAQNNPGNFARIAENYSNYQKTPEESVDENGQDSHDAEEISLDDREQTCEGGRDNSGTQDESSSSTPIPSTTEIIEALVHTSEREIECMRQQENRVTIHSLEGGIKGPGLEDYYVERSPGLNTCRLSMERLSGATDNLSAPMDIDLNEFNPILRTSSPTVEISPIIGFKRPRAPEAIEAKRKKIDAQMDVENEINKDIAVQVTPVIENVAVQADIRKIVRNNEAQTEELQTLINERVRDVQDFCVQYGASHNNVGIQTVTHDFGDASTQTEFEYFRNFRIYIGEINLFFT